VDVVRYTADRQGVAIQVFEDAAQIGVHFFAYGGVFQKGKPIFGREDRVEQDFCEGLRHCPTVNGPVG